MFEWDENKNQINIAKHGIDFKLALEVFSDQRALEKFNRDINGEQCYHIIGSIHGEVIVLFVVFTKRGENRRIISARKASKKERKLYENPKFIKD